MYRKQTNAEGGDSRRILTAREIELLMGNNCHGGEGGGRKTKSEEERKIVLNTKKENEVLYSAVPGCLQVPSACRLG